MLLELEYCGIILTNSHPALPYCLVYFVIHLHYTEQSVILKLYIPSFSRQSLPSSIISTTGCIPLLLIISFLMMISPAQIPLKYFRPYHTVIGL